MLDDLTRVEGALLTVLPQIKPVWDVEHLEIEKACGRVLAEDIRSPANVPSCLTAALYSYTFMKRLPKKVKIVDAVDENRRS